MVRPRSICRVRELMRPTTVVYQPWININGPLGGSRLFLLASIFAITTIAIDRKFGC